MSQQHLTADRLRATFSYDAATGLFTRLISRGNRRAGHVQTSLRNDGYNGFAIDKKLYLAHRLAWLYVYGRWPDGTIDHINRNKSDNRIENLREVTQAENLQNTIARIDCSSGLKGVQLRRGRWNARITVGQKRTHIGTFNSPEAAAKAYAEAARRMHKFNPSALGVQK
jgi:hypothetical protein